MFLYRFEYRDAMAYDLTDLELFLQVVDRGSIIQGTQRTHPQQRAVGHCDRRRAHGFGVPRRACDQSSGGEIEHRCTVSPTRT